MMKIAQIQLTSPTLGMNQSSSDSSHQQTIIDVKFNNSIQSGVSFIEELVKFLRLHNSSRKSVQQKAIFALRLVKIGVNQIDDEIIRYQLK
jgi:hypothetical protein